MLLKVKRHDWVEGTSILVAMEDYDIIHGNKVDSNGKVRAQYMVTKIPGMDQMAPWINESTFEEEMRMCATYVLHKVHMETASSSVSYYQYPVDRKEMFGTGREVVKMEEALKGNIFDTLLK